MWLIWLIFCLSREDWYCITKLVNVSLGLFPFGQKIQHSKPRCQKKTVKTPPYKFLWPYNKCKKNSICKVFRGAIKLAWKNMHLSSRSSTLQVERTGRWQSTKTWTHSKRCWSVCLVQNLWKRHSHRWNLCRWFFAGSTLALVEGAHKYLPKRFEMRCLPSTRSISLNIHHNPLTEDVS